MVKMQEKVESWSERDDATVQRVMTPVRFTRLCGRDAPNFLSTTSNDTTSLTDRPHCLDRIQYLGALE